MGAAFLRTAIVNTKERKEQKFEANAEYRLSSYEELHELFYPHRIKETETK